MVTSSVWEIHGPSRCRYDVSNVLDTVYWGFLGVGTTFDIFQNILFPYSLNTAYWFYWIQRIGSCFLRGLCSMNAVPFSLLSPRSVVGEIHKEAQQVAGGPTSLGATSEEGARPQLNSGTNPSVLVDKTKSAGNGLKATHTDSDESGEEETKKDKETHTTSYDVPEDTSVPHPSSPKSDQIQELMA
ncbi:hypothetical protein Tco_0514096 [Tanacetum coccineum]